MQDTTGTDVREQISGDAKTESGLDTDRDRSGADFERLREDLESGDGPLIDGRYRVERLLGRGAMGEVYLAHDQKLDRSVALKLVLASSADTALRLQVRLEREALALARVAHPNVVGIHDVGTHAGQTYLTMQFVPGTTLRQWQRNGRASSEVIDAYLQAGRGLAAAHSGGVMHRDFKPDNVIVGDDGLVRVLDFGLAAALQPETQEEQPEPLEPPNDAAARAASTLETLPGDASDSGSGSAPTIGQTPHAGRTGSAMSERMTRVGSLLGTMAYMSSEQLEGRDADARSDQFSFCVAMWEGLTGKRPFPGGGIFELVLSIERGPQNPNGIPRWLRPILVKGLDHKPGRRWPSMTELIHAIERGRTRGRKLALGLGLPTAILAAVWVDRQLHEPPPEPDTCAPFVGQMDERWGATQRDAITAHVGIDAEATAYAVASLDRLASDWKLAATATCSSPAHDPQRECLQRWLDSFDRTVELLAEHGDQKTLAHAPDLLAQLKPPNSDYCALGPAKPCDPEVVRLTEHARSLAILGDLDDAREMADAGLARATGLDQREFSGERALAHAARAEVAMAESDMPLANEQFQLAQRNALATDFPHVLLSTWTWWAKLLVAIDSKSRKPQPELALVRIEQAEPLVFSLSLGEHDPRRAELIEARGMSERARGNYTDAIALHREAQALFMAAGLPTLASKSLLNVGANYYDLGELERARESYVEALALLDAAGLPASYRNRIWLERNLGLAAYASTDPSTIRQGLPHYEFVLAHGSESERFEAHELILALVLELDDAELTRHWVERALEALEQRPHATVEEAFRIQRVAGIALAYSGDPRGEELLRAAEQSSESLSRLIQFNLQSSWVDWLEHVGRCDEAHDRRERLAERLAHADADVAALHAQWRAAGPTGRCSTQTSTPPRSTGSP